MFGVAEPLADDLSQRELADAIRCMPRLAEREPTVVDLLLDGYVAVILEGWSAASARLQSAIAGWPKAAVTPAAVHRHPRPTHLGRILPVGLRGGAPTGRERHDDHASRRVREPASIRTRLPGTAGSSTRQVQPCRGDSGRSGGPVADDGRREQLGAVAHCGDTGLAGSYDEAHLMIEDLHRLATAQQLGTAVHMAHLSDRRARQQHAAVLRRGGRRPGDLGQPHLRVHQPSARRARRGVGSTQ